MTMTYTKFKVGDTVRLIKDGSGNCSRNPVLGIGDTFVVKDVCINKNYKDDIYYRPRFKEATGVEEDYLELVTSANLILTDYDIY